MMRALAGFALFSAAFADSPVASWIDSLRAQGFVVQEGDYGFYDTETCKKADTCYAMNPLTPYGLSWLPPSPAEASTEVKFESSCVKHNICRGNDTHPWSPSWRIARGEVVVLVGRAPPESVYWSVAPALYSRYHSAPSVPRIPSLDRTVVACPPALLKGRRCEVFSGINDPVNFLSANFSDGRPFDTDFALVVAWDAVSERKVFEELEQAGQRNVNMLRMPGAIGQLGVTTGMEDEWMTILRVEGIKNESAAKEFYTGSPFRTFRVTPPASFDVPEDALFPSFDGRMRERVTGKGEGASDASFQDLQAALGRLHDLVISEEHKRFNGTQRHVASMEFSSWVNDSGYECLSAGTKCQGDCRDTVYAKATFAIREVECLPLPKVGPCNPAEHGYLTEDYGDSIFAIGVNHKATRQALYSSVTAYDVPKLAAVSPGITDDIYAGSAEKYLGKDDPAAKYFYVVKFTRHCDPDDIDLCVEVPIRSDNPSVNPLALNNAVAFVERMYINPTTRAGPAVSETILGKLVHFRPQSNAIVI